MTEVLASLSLIIGTFFIAVSAIGLIRMPDVYSRLHAVTKSSTFGIAGVLLGSAIVFGTAGENVYVEILTMWFVFMTNPVGGHMIARSAYLAGVRMTHISVIDEMDRAGEWADAEHDTD